MQTAGGGDVDHLLAEDAVTAGPGLKGSPVAGAGGQWFVLGDDLVLHDVEAAGEVALGLEDGAVGVVLGERAVGGVVEGAVVALGVFVFELEKAFLAGEAVGFRVNLVDGRGGVVNVGGGVEAGFSGGEGLEGVGPEGAFIGVREFGEARAVWADGVRGLCGEEIGGERFFDESVPGWVPGVGVVEFGFLFGDGGRGSGGGLGLLRGVLWRRWC